MKRSIYILVIEHKYGTDVSAHLTQAEADQSLALYCRDWWDTECRGSYRDDEENNRPAVWGDPPSDPQELVSIYFNIVLGEDAQIQQCEVDFGPENNATDSTS